MCVYICTYVCIYMYITYMHTYMMQGNQQAFYVSISTYNTYVYICIFLICTYTSCNSINRHPKR